MKPCTNNVCCKNRLLAETMQVCLEILDKKEENIKKLEEICQSIIDQGTKYDSIYKMEIDDNDILKERLKKIIQEDVC